METRTPARWVALCLGTILAAGTVPVAAKILYVDDDAPPGGTGHSWDQALADLTTALEEARGGDEIRLAGGRYSPSWGQFSSSGGRGGGRTYSLWHVTASLRILGGFAGPGADDPNQRAPRDRPTILSGDILGNDPPTLPLVGVPSQSDNTPSLLVCDPRESEPARLTLDGLTLTDAVDSALTAGAGWRLEVRDCLFRRHTSRAGGAAVRLGRTESARFVACRFIDNLALGSGGAVAVASADTEVRFEACHWEGNLALGDGGALHATSGLVRFEACRLIANQTESSGGAVSAEAADATLSACVLSGNIAHDEGGAVAGSGRNLRLIDCLVTGNVAGRTGTAVSATSVTLEIDHCTVAANSRLGWQTQGTGTAIYYGENWGRGHPGMMREPSRVHNSILWNEGPELSSQIETSHCHMRGLADDPRFVDPLGPDGLPGTGDEDYHLAPDSPCINAGDPNGPSPDLAFDLDGRPRALGLPDLGAYESGHAWHVDGRRGNDTADGRSPQRALARIQTALNRAARGDVILVSAGTYAESLVLPGVSVELRGVPGPAGLPIVESPTTALRFPAQAGPASLVRNLIIRNSPVAVSVGSSALLRNLTVVNCGKALDLDAWAGAVIRNSVFAATALGNLPLADVAFCRADTPLDGCGNLTAEPGFADPAAGDVHLRSAGGRFDPRLGAFVADATTSPCVDAGDFATPPGAESIPNGGRVNLGAFGGTAQASRSAGPGPWVALLPLPDGETVPVTLRAWAAAQTPIVELFFTVADVTVPAEQTGDHTWSGIWYPRTSDRIQVTAVAVDATGTESRSESQWIETRVGGGGGGRGWR